MSSVSVIVRGQRRPDPSRSPAVAKRIVRIKESCGTVETSDLSSSAHSAYRSTVVSMNPKYAPLKEVVEERLRDIIETRELTYSTADSNFFTLMISCTAETPSDTSPTGVDRNVRVGRGKDGD